jgi:hypothetical protein
MKTLLFRSGLRYYDVETLSPLHSTRQTCCMWISASKQALQIAKLNLSNFDENSVISFRIEILRRLNALATPFYTPNVVHVDFSVETIPVNRKPNLSNIDENSVISIRIETFRRLKAL